MLGELYRPMGKALEHARVVLETEEPYAVNVALGCSVGARASGGKLLEDSQGSRGLMPLIEGYARSLYF